MGSPLRVALLAGAALVVFATGLRLTRAGRPYGTALLTVHKLVDLAAIVFIAAIVVAAFGSAGATGLDWALLAAAAVAAIATFATGGVLTASDTAAAWILTAHRVLPWPLLLLLGTTVYRALARQG